MFNVGLVLEGGGMRGLYTAGVLDFFLENNIHFNYVVGVSAGACNAASYISKQKGRNKIVNTAFINDWRYMSLKNLILKGSLFGMDFIFDEIPNKLVPFDFDVFNKSSVIFKIGVTDCNSGKPLHFDKGDLYQTLTVLRASSSLPLVSPIVQFNGYELLDGGIADPIPICRAISDGYHKNVIVLTRNKGYIKKPINPIEQLLLKTKYRKYPVLVKTILNRHKIYNETLEYIENLEQRKQSVVIRPTEKIKVDRFEKNIDKLLNLYNLGHEDADTVFKRELSGWS